MKKSLAVLVASIVIFLALLSIGFQLASKKPLWNDEAFSQVNSIQQLSYAQIIFEHNPEGNICPLFYLIQKCIGDIAGFKIPLPWDVNTIVDPKAQFILRIAPNVCMSLAITLLFYFFARFYSWSLGIYALVLCLSSFMVWAYWAEARPYALWFLLTTVQMLIFSQLLNTKKNYPSWFTGFTIVNFLLSFTVIFSAIQISVITLLLWIFKERNWKKYAYSSIVPIAICLYYYSHTRVDQFWFSGSIWKFITTNVASDIFCLATFYLAVLLLTQKKLAKASDAFLFCILLMILSLNTLLFISAITYGHVPTERYELSVRYYIFLAPLGIITACYVLKELCGFYQRQRWALGSLILMVVGLVIMRCVEVYPLIIKLYK